MKENEKVKYAHMHQTGFVPGLKKHVEKALDQQTFPGIEMELGFAGVNCKYNGTRFILPYVNFQSIVLEDESSEPKEQFKKKKDA